MEDSSCQTDRTRPGHGPRLSKVNLFTLLSLWMELFPREEPEEDENLQVRAVGLVVVKEGKVVGLHSSDARLHAGQAAVLRHGARLTHSHLYFSRRPCATCLKMIINVGVSQISFWPGDPELSLLQPGDEEAALDVVAAERLKSNSRAHVCVLLQPLTPGLLQFITESSRDSDFMGRKRQDDPRLDAQDIFNRERRRHLQDFSRRFLVGTSQQHQEVLTRMGLENFCVEPYFSGLRHNMVELLEALAAVAAAVSHHDYGFYREQQDATPPPHGEEEVSQEVARHCMTQAGLLAYRTEDPKRGVGAVIWAKGHSACCSGTGRLDLVGCGYNAYPAGSHYAQYPQMDDKQEDRQRRKYRYMIHAEQNALSFRSRDLRPDDVILLFVTKCPCDECVPLLLGAGVSSIYTSDQDRGRDKGDISYLRFSSLKDVHRFTWQRSPSPHLVNGFVGKHSRQTEPERHRNKKLCTSRSTHS